METSAPPHPSGPLLLRPQPLTAAAFAEFGEVIGRAGHTPVSINDGSTARWHALARVQLDDKGYGIINLFDSQPTALPLAVRCMERHPLGSQAFVPLGSSPFVVVVAHAFSGPHVPPGHLRAFVTDGTQGVNYHRNVWHHAVIALQETCFVVVDRGGGAGDNCEFADVGGEALLLAP